MTFVGDALATAQIRARALELARGAIACGMLTSRAWRERFAEPPTAPSRILWWVQAEAMLGLVVLSLRWHDAEMAAVVLGHRFENDARLAMLAQADDDAAVRPVHVRL